MVSMTTESKHSVGELLKQGRLRQRLSISECTKRTHIAPRYIEAIEEENWSTLPSESHRLGFLRLYSRFLGVSTDEVLKLYKQKNEQAQASKSGMPAVAPVKPESSVRLREASGSSAWSPSSIPQVIGLLILLLILAWVLYHAVTPHLFEQNQMPWTRRRPSTQSRLVVPKAAESVHKVQLRAEASSWLRVTSKNELLYEGILPAGSVKEWSGQGPFQFKIGNNHAVSLFWNNQPVDLTLGARGKVSEIRIPPQSQ
jgi:cytoskeleton protein RodZ